MVSTSRPTTPPATPVAIPAAAPVSPEEERIRGELQEIFLDLDLSTSAQELSYEMFTLEPKDAYTRDGASPLSPTQ